MEKLIHESLTLFHCRKHLIFQGGDELVHNPYTFKFKPLKLNWNLPINMWREGRLIMSMTDWSWSPVKRGRFVKLSNFCSWDFGDPASLYACKFYLYQKSYIVSCIYMFIIVYILLLYISTQCYVVFSVYFAVHYITWCSWWHLPTVYNTYCWSNGEQESQNGQLYLGLPALFPIRSISGFV